jgi:hypothetical protein
MYICIQGMAQLAFASKMARHVGALDGDESSSHFAYRSTIYASNLYDKLHALKSNETICNEMIAGFIDEAREAIEYQEGIDVDNQGRSCSASYYGSSADRLHRLRIDDERL